MEGFYYVDFLITERVGLYGLINYKKINNDKKNEEEKMFTFIF